MDVPLHLGRAGKFLNPWGCSEGGVKTSVLSRLTLPSLGEHPTVSDSGDAYGVLRNKADVHSDGPRGPG